MIQKYTYDWWQKEHKRSKEDRDDFIDTANRSVRLYRREHTLDDCARSMSVWWSLISTLIPACFSRVPKVDISQRRKRGGIRERLGGIAWERATQYSIEEDFDFKAVGYESLLQYFLTGHGILWARYEAEFADREYKYALDKKEDGYYRSESERYEGEEETIQADEQGQYYANEIIPTKERERAILESINYKDFRTSCARNEAEVYWKARRSYLTFEGVEEKLGKEIAKQCNYNSFPEDTKKRSKDSDEKRDMEGKAEFWENYCLESGKVYWMHSGKKGVLESGDPPVKFAGFWPCVELKQNIEPNSAVPFSDFKEVEDMVLEVERLTTRIHANIQAIRANMMYDASLGELMEDLLKGDLRMIPAKLSATQRGKGGLAGSVEPLNIEPYVRALEILSNAREQALQKLFDATAASDLIRGSTAVQKTATANQLEANFTNLRFSVRRENVVEFFTEGIKLVGEIIAEEFSTQSIYEATYGEELVAEVPQPQPQQGMPPAPPPDPMQVFEEIISFLRDDRARRYKLDIESDSIVELDQRADRQERSDAISSIGQFLQQIEPIMQRFPAAAGFAGSMIKFVTRSYKAGKEIEGEILGTFEAMVQHAQQMAQNQPPDPKLMEVQAKLKIAEMESQARQIESQAEVQKSQIEIQNEQLRTQSDIQINQQKLGIQFEELKLKQFQIQTEAEAKMQELQLKAQEILASSSQKEQETAVNEKFRTIEQLLDKQRVEIEQYKAQTSAYEALLEERRLAKEKIEEVKAEAQKVKKDPAINVTLQLPKAEKRKGRIKRSDGTISEIEVD